MRSTADVALFSVVGPELKVLLIQRGGELEHGKWAMPGGHVDSEDYYDIEKTAIREMEEETGINLLQEPYPIHIRYAFSETEGDWSGVFFWGVAGRHHNLTGMRAGSDAMDIGWFSLAELMKLEMAFDHRSILEKFFTLVERLVA
jgi:8-oxo-dGTP diphosphatase